MKRNPLVCVAFAASTAVNVCPQNVLAQDAAAASLADAEAPSQAESLFAQAQTHYNLGEYDEAIELFRRSYELSREALLIYNIAQALRLKGDCIRARDSYRDFLRLASESKERADLAREEELAQAHLAALQQRCQPDVTEARAATKEPSPVPAAPPVQRPSLSAKIAPPENAHRLRPLIWGLAGAGIASGALGVYFATDVRRRSQADSAAPRFDPSRDDQGRRAERLQWAFLGGGAVALAASGALTWLNIRSEKPRLVLLPRFALGEIGLTFDLVR
jgi:tetratricopeptide (TPR) repeat protein